jgi:hypothetical protein
MLKVKVRYTGPTTSIMTGPESDAQGEGKIHMTNYLEHQTLVLSF